MLINFEVKKYLKDFLTLKASILANNQRSAFFVDRVTNNYLIMQYTHIAVYDTKQLTESVQGRKHRRTGIEKNRNKCNTNDT